ncbi:hypothetical protein Tco_1562697 [Tanacetum coccineum]
MEKETTKSDNKEDQGRNQEWIKVTQRQRGSKKVVYDEHSPQHNYNHVIKKGLLDFDNVMRDKVISFFFTNFPETWYFAALWKMFNRYGDVASFEGRLKSILIGNSKLVINRAKLIKVGDMGVLTSDFPPFNPGKQHILKASKPHANPSFKEAVLGPKAHAKQPLKTILIEENAFLCSKLECCWIGEARNFHVFQNAWSIVEDNGLVDCKLKSAWLLIEGLPPLGRDYNSVKNITRESGRILEVGRLYFDSKLFLPIKSLVLLPDMNVVSESLMVSLNGKYFPIRVFEEPFQASCLVSPPSDSDDASIFEEEFIEPSMDRDGLDVDLSGDSSSDGDSSS